MMRLKVLPFFILMFTLLFQIAIPESVLELNHLSPDTVTDLADFNDSDEDPTDDTSDDKFEVAEVLYPIFNITHYIKLSPILPEGRLPSFICSYSDQWHIPPSAA